MGVEAVPDRMQACQVIEFKKPYKIQSVAAPQPDSLDADDILVKLAVASLCHTDEMVVNGLFGTELPCTASHEGAGTVVGVGANVKRFKVGDRAMCGIPYHTCGECADCQGPDKQYCTKVKHTGIVRDGNFAEYVVVDSRMSCKLPDIVSFETAAPLACAGCTIYKGILQSECREGEWLGIVGSGGGLGHLGVQFAKALGIKVVGVDARDSALELTRKYGADVTVDAREGDDAAEKAVMDATGGVGCKSTLAVSDAKGAAALSCRITRMHGTVVQIAQPDEVVIPFAQLVFRDVRIKGSLVCNQEEAARMLDDAAKYGVTVTTHKVEGLDRVPELVELAHAGKLSGKGIVVIDQAQIDEQNSQGLKMV